MAEPSLRDLMNTIDKEMSLTEIMTAVDLEAEENQKKPGVKERFLSAIGPPIAKVLDLISRPTYAASNVAVELAQGDLREIPQAFSAGIRGERKGSGKDVLAEVLPESRNWPGWLQAATGIGIELLNPLDPTSFLGAGIARGVARAAPGVTRALSSPVQAAINELAETETGKWLRRIFSAHAPVSDEEFVAKYEQSQNMVKHLINQAISSNVPLEKAMRDIEKNLGIPRNVVLELIEKTKETKTVSPPPAQEVTPSIQKKQKKNAKSPVKDVELPAATPAATPGPPDQKTIEELIKQTGIIDVSKVPNKQPLIDFLSDYWERQATRVEIEKAAGVPITHFQSDVLNYATHIMNEEAKEAIRKRFGSLDNFRRHILNLRVKHPFTNQRVLFRDLSVEEINQIGRRGEFPGLESYKGPIFIDDPVRLNLIRDVASAKAIASAKFLQEIIANPEWAKQTSEATGGYRALNDATRKRLGPLVEGISFRNDIAEALEQWTRVNYDPEETAKFWEIYDKIHNFVKRTALVDPQWSISNIVGYLWNGALLAGNKNPINWITSIRLLLRGSKLNYRVEKGETLSEIANRFGVTIEDLVKANNIQDPNKIKAGQALKIPASSKKIGGYSENEVFDLADQHGILLGGLYGTAKAMSPEQALKVAVEGPSISHPIREWFRANAFLEDSARLSLFIDGLKKGLSPEQAAKRVKKYLYDINNLSPIEREKIGRFVTFYSFHKQNLMLQIEELLKQPEKQTLLAKALPYEYEAMGAQEPGAAQPEYLQTQLTAPVGKPTEQGTFPSVGLYPIPLAEPLSMAAEGVRAAEQGQSLLEQLLFGAAGSLGRPLVASNPIGGALAALTLGYSPYQGRELQEDRLRQLGPMTTTERLYETAANLFPPLRDIRRITEEPVQGGIPLARLGAETSPLRRTGEFLAGIRLQWRNIPLEVRAAINHIQTQINDLQRLMATEAIKGNQKMVEKYKSRILELTDAMKRLSEQYNTLREEEE